MSTERLMTSLVAMAARLAATVAVVALLVVFGASTANAYTVAGATFLPDHGAPGAAIVVEGLPLAADCPRVEVWLAEGPAPTPAITSSADPRLLRLDGTVRVEPIGAGGAGDTRPATTFAFRVPSLRPGMYSTFSECSGGPSGSAAFAAFAAGATTFTIEPGAPETSTIANATMPSGAPATLPALLAIGTAALILVRRSPGTRRAPAGGGRGRTLAARPSDDVTRSART